MSKGKKIVIWSIGVLFTIVVTSIITVKEWHKLS